MSGPTAKDLGIDVDDATRRRFKRIDRRQRKWMGVLISDGGVFVDSRIGISARLKRNNEPALAREMERRKVIDGEILTLNLMQSRPYWGAWSESGVRMLGGDEPRDDVTIDWGDGK